VRDITTYVFLLVGNKSTTMTEIEVNVSAGSGGRNPRESYLLLGPCKGRSLIAASTGDVPGFAVQKKVKEGPSTEKKGWGKGRSSQGRASNYGLLKSSKRGAPGAEILRLKLGSGGGGGGSKYNNNKKIDRGSPKKHKRLFEAETLHAKALGEKGSFGGRRGKTDFFGEKADRRAEAAVSL